MSRTTDLDAALPRARAACFDFAGVGEKLSHGAPFFHVRGKGFAIFARDHQGAGGPALWCRSTAAEQRRLVAADRALYFVPPYVGVKGWVAVRLDAPGCDDATLSILVEEAWRSVAPKRLERDAPAPPKPVSYPTTDPAVVADALARLSALCEPLAGTVTERAAGHATFRVGKRPYAYLLDNQHRDGIVAVVFRSDEGAALAAKEPRRYYAPAYMDAAAWVAMRVDRAKTPWRRLAAHVTASHARVAPKSRGATVRG
jgi:hypothetical protein